jgi:hypothetical protein
MSTNRLNPAIRNPSVIGRTFLFFLFLVGQFESHVAASAFPLHVEGQQLFDSEGQKFVVLGDAAWTLIVALPLEAADTYLSVRKAQGFNTLLVELVEPEFSGPQNRYGDVPFPVGAEFTELSSEYFARAKSVLDLAAKQGFLVLLTPAYLGWQCGENGWCQQMLRTPDALLESYGRAIGSLLAEYPNIVWVHGGDVDPNLYQARTKVEAVYRGIASAVPTALHTAHCSRNLSAVDCYDWSWLSMNTTYSDCNQTPALIRKDQQRVTRMPSLYIEGRYEEEGATDLCLRSQMWWSFLGGSIGHVFGNKRIWRFESDWQKALDTNGARAMTVASKLLAKLQVTSRELNETAIRLNTWATALLRLSKPPSQLGEVWSGLAGSALEIPVASSATSTIAYLPYPTSLSYSRSGDTLCWVDPRSGAITSSLTSVRNSPSRQRAA